MKGNKMNTDQRLREIIANNPIEPFSYGWAGAGQFFSRLFSPTFSASKRKYAENLLAQRGMVEALDRRGLKFSKLYSMWQERAAHCRLCCLVHAIKGV